MNSLRKDHLEAQLSQDYKFLNNVRNRLRYTGDPREQGNLELTIEEIEQRISNYEAELNSLKNKGLKTKNQLISEGCELLKNGRLKEAENKFDQAQRLDNQLAEPWYWKAQVALADNNQPVALKYIEKALKLDSNNLDCRVLQIKILLLSGGEHRQQAKEIAEEVSNISSDLKAWVDDLKNENVFSSLVITSRELEMKFPVSISEN